MKFSLFEHAKDNEPQRHNGKLFPVLAEKVERCKRKNDTKAWSPAAYPPGKVRRAKNVESVSCFVMDVDEASDDELSAIQEAAAGFEHLWHTSYSHGKKPGNCYRFVFPLAEAASGQDWLGTWQGFMRLFGAKASDPKCKDPSRIYFRPTEDAELGTNAGPKLSVKDIPGIAPGTFVVPNVEPTKVTAKRLQSLASIWKKSRTEHKKFIGDALERVVKGERYAEDGARDDTAWQIALGLAQEWPGLDIDQVAALFVESSNKMGDQPPDIREKLERAVQQAIQELADQKQQLLGNLPSGESYYKPKDVPEDMAHKWLVQYKNSWLFWTGKTYSRMYTREEALNAAEMYLSKAALLGIALFEPSQDGGPPKRKAIIDLVAQYGSLTDEVVLDMCAKESVFDLEARVLVQAPCPLRNLEPAYDKTVDEWLKVFAGPAYEDLMTWLEHYLDLWRPAAALVLTGPKGVGKSQFAHQLSRLHTELGAVDMGHVFDSFNQDLTRCPLVLADEGLPRNYRGYLRTTEIRSFISDEQRLLRRKYLPEVVLKGCCRVVVTANNENVLFTGETLSKDDIAALNDRFYHIQVPEEAGPLIAKHAARWKAEDSVARHVLHLIGSRSAEVSTERFIIVPRTDSLFRRMKVMSGLRSAVCQWCVNYLKSKRTFKHPGVLIRDGHIWIRAEALLASWPQFVDDKLPDATALSRAVVAVAGERKNINKGWVRPVDVESLTDWAEMTDAATTEEITQWLTEERKLRAV